MRLIKPKRLKCGDVIGICSPASSPQSEEKLNRGICYLEKIGFRIVLGKYLTKKYGYLAGTDKERASDLNNLFKDPKVKAIFTTRGGYGSHRILPLLDYDAIKDNPKILVGYSDISALHLSLLSKIGLITFSGPMVSVEMSDGLAGKTEERFWDMLMSTNSPEPIVATNSKQNISFHRGKVSGRLIGGNLSLFNNLIGTQYLPIISNQILILEEIDEQPYRIDRMFQQLKSSNIFKNVRGIALGSFVSCTAQKNRPTLTLKEIFKETFHNIDIPVVSGFRYGHIKNSVCFPVGVKVQLNSYDKSLRFLESGIKK